MWTPTTTNQDQVLVNEKISCPVSEPQEFYNEIDLAKKIAEKHYLEVNH